MSPLILALIVTSLLAYVAGQLLLKVAMADEEEKVATPEGDAPAPIADKVSKRKRIAFFTASIACMTVTFFINLGLLQKLDLSFLFPFQGLSVIIVTFGASIFLKERLTITLVVGAVLITVGVMLVSAS
jgi:drug/metabolite transporter (DMT)-like permease